ARPGTPRRVERLLRVPARPRRSPDRALHVRLLHRRSGPEASALVGQRSTVPLLLGHPSTRLLVRGVVAVTGPRRAARAGRVCTRRRTNGSDGMPTTTTAINRPTTPTQLLIDGSWRDAADGGTFDVIAPATEEVIAQLAAASAADVDAAVRAARA